MRLPDAAFLHRLADAADEITLMHYRIPIDVEEKHKPGYRFDPVTIADRQAELAIRDIIGKEFPEHAVLGEEHGESGEGAVRWVVDPIDGTRPYILGIPVWGTLIGLTVQGRAKMGIMSQPFTGERFWTDGNGAWTRGRMGTARLRTRPAGSLSEAILHTNSPEGFAGEGEAGFRRLRDGVRMTRYGGECYAFAMLAAGRIDLCLEPSLQPYDIVALVPIIEQAGGVVSTLSGRPPEDGGPILASADALLHEQALGLLAGR